MGIGQLLCRHESLYEHTYTSPPTLTFSGWRTETHYQCVDCGKVVLRVMTGIGSAYPPHTKEGEGR